MLFFSEQFPSITIYILLTPLFNVRTEKKNTSKKQWGALYGKYQEINRLLFYPKIESLLYCVSEWVYRSNAIPKYLFVRPLYVFFNIIWTEHMLLLMIHIFIWYANLIIPETRECWFVILLIYLSMRLSIYSTRITLLPITIFWKSNATGCTVSSLNRRHDGFDSISTKVRFMRNTLALFVLWFNTQCQMDLLDAYGNDK